MLGLKGVAMRKDALDAIYGRMPDKIPRKERLNNYQLLLAGSGIDPYEDLEKAYTDTVKKYGIDMVSMVPENYEAVREEQIHGAQIIKKRKAAYKMAPLGVMPTYQIFDYGFQSVEDVIAYDPESEEYHGLWLISGSNDRKVLNRAYEQSYRRSKEMAGECFLNYPYFYNLLFMWCMETFGFELFMLAAIQEEEALDRILEKFQRRSEKHIQAMLDTDAPVIVVHDDLARATGSIMNPKWYEKHLYPRYQKLTAQVHQRGKKILLTIDGRVDDLIDDLKACGFDGFEIECPASDLRLVLKKCRDLAVVGGIDNRIITFSSPDQVAVHTREVLALGKEYPGFIMSNTGGFHGNVPLDNAIAYMETANSYGVR